MSDLGFEFTMIGSVVWHWGLLLKQECVSACKSLCLGVCWWFIYLKFILICFGLGLYV